MLHPYVSVHAAAALAEAAPDRYVEIDATLAFFDVSGFTPMTERLASLGRAGAEHINDVLNVVFTGLIDAVSGWGGDVLEFGGDAMVVLYSGTRHAERAAAGAAEAFAFMRRANPVTTPVGKVTLGMSCGMASGAQAYYLLGRTRRAFVVAGPVSTAMARCEAAAPSGEAWLAPSSAAALPRAWVERCDGDGYRLLHRRVRADPALHGAIDRGARDDTSALLPTEFRDLVDVGRRSGELKQVAMAFLRLTGTDGLIAAGGPAAAAAVLGELSELIDTTAAEFGVCWLETQAEADSVRWTLISGAPTATERDGERLLRVVRRIADAAPQPLHIGANLGVVFVGDMGHPDRCTYIVMGDTTNLAARLMGRAEAGQVLVGERLAHATAGRFAFEWPDPFTVKGKARPVQAAVLGPMVEAGRDAPASQPAATPPLVGRDDQLHELVAAIRDAAVVVVTGEAGSGKSRLWHEARAVLGDRSWVAAGGDPYEQSSAFAPMRRLLRTLFDATDGDALARHVGRVAPDLAGWLPLVGDVLGFDVEPTAQTASLDPTFRAERQRLAVAELVSATVAGRPTVLVVDDVHWLDEASRALVATIARTQPDTAVVLTARPGGWLPPADVTVDLPPVPPHEAERLLIQALPGRLAADATLARLTRAAGGNPLFLLELARAAAVTGDDTALPDSVERLMAARIDRLPAAARARVRDLSVLGATVDRALAAGVLGLADPADLDAWTAGFDDLLVDDGTELHFAHDMIRVAAYEGLAVRRRRAVHAAAVRVIEAWGDAAPLADPVAVLAVHAAGAADDPRIVRWSGRAADEALASGATTVAIGLYQAVADAQRRLRAEPVERVATLRRLACAAERAGRPDTALDALAQAARYVTGPDRSALAVDRARLLERSGRYRAAQAMATRAANATTDQVVRAHLALSRATVRNLVGDHRGALTLAEQALADPVAGSDRAVAAQAHVLAEWACSALRLPERESHDTEAERLLVELDDTVRLANLYLNRGVSRYADSRIAEAIDSLQASAEQYRKAGDVLGEAGADNNLGEALTTLFRLDEAEPRLARARRVSAAAGDPYYELAATSGLARIAAWRGDTETAVGLEQAAIDGFGRLGASDLEFDSLVRMVEIQLLHGDPEAALAIADRAARAGGARAATPTGRATLERLRARVLVALDRPDEAYAAFTTARALAEQDTARHELALATIGLGQLDGDDGAVAKGLAALAELDVLAPPPGTLAPTPERRSG